MMTGVGLILSFVAIDTFIENRTIGGVSIVVALATFFALAGDPNNLHLCSVRPCRGRHHRLSLRRVQADRRRCQAGKGATFDPFLGMVCGILVRFFRTLLL
jgi:hypothetical protein